jgi:hypothetical protein
MDWPLLAHLLQLAACTWPLFVTVTEATVAFTPEPTILKLVFDESTPLHGLTVKMRPCTVGEWHNMLSKGDMSVTSQEAVNINNEIAQVFIDHLVEWDLEIPAGHPVEHNLEGWNTIENGHSNLLMSAWQVAMIQVPKSWRTNSDDGKTSEEQSLDLAKLSESLPSWKEPNS